MVICYCFVPDSDYQLGSAAQTPGLNNVVNSVDYVGVQPTHTTPLAEAYGARDRTYVPGPQQPVTTTYKLFNLIFVYHRVFIRVMK